MRAGGMTVPTRAIATGRPILVGREAARQATKLTHAQARTAVVQGKWANFLCGAARGSAALGFGARALRRTGGGVACATAPLAPLRRGFLAYPGPEGFEVGAPYRCLLGEAHTSKGGRAGGNKNEACLLTLHHLTQTETKKVGTPPGVTAGMVLERTAQSSGTCRTSSLACKFGGEE